MRDEVIRINSNWLKAYCAYVFYIVLMILLSIMRATTLNNIIRFSLILLVLPLFCIEKNTDFTFEYNIFIFFAIIKSIFISYIAIELLRTGSYLEYRSLAHIEGYGDIYISSFDHLPKIQVQGNAFLPFAHILASCVFNKDKNIKNLLIAIILFLGTVAAGNSAFILGLSLYYGFVMIRYLKQRHKTLLMSLLVIAFLLIGVVAFTIYSYNTMQAKAEHSNAVRVEQLKALTSDSYFVVGNGIGHEINYSGNLIKYSGNNKYFELQTLYIFNQIGLIGMLLIYSLLLIPLCKTGKLELTIFLIYLIYSFWNPYCFDTTEMIVLALLINFRTYTIPKAKFEVISIRTI